MNKFQLPIEFLKNKLKILDNLKTDLELEKTIDPSNTPIYHFIFQPKTELGKDSISAWSKYYTTNKHFLKDSQKLYTKINDFPFTNSIKYSDPSLKILN